jgi:hypothetical protein
MSYCCDVNLSQRVMCPLIWGWCVLWFQVDVSFDFRLMCPLISGWCVLWFQVECVLWFQVECVLWFQVDVSFDFRLNVSFDFRLMCPLISGWCVLWFQVECVLWFQVDVPFDFHRSIIGQKGRDVRELMDRYDVHIVLSPADQRLDIIKVSVLLTGLWLELILRPLGIKMSVM